MMSSHVSITRFGSTKTQHVPMQTTTYFGIDVSKDDLHIAWQDQQKTWHYEKIANQLPTIEGFIEQHITAQNTQSVIEHTGTYSHRLVLALALAGRSFSLITPYQSKGFAQVMKTSAKTDQQDAHRLALYGQRMQPDLSQLVEEELHHSRQCHKRLADLRTDLQATLNRLHALDYDPRASDKVRQSLLTSQATLQEEITSFETDLDQMSQDHLRQVAEQMQTVTGIGPATSQALAIATNGLSNFSSAKSFAKFVGVAPSVGESGSSVRHKGRISRSGNGPLRGLLYMAARSARKYNRACKALYDRLTASGRCHKVAMVAVMNKLLHQVFAVVKSGVAFDNYYGQPKENLA
jgi:transposase